VFKIIVAGARCTTCSIVARGLEVLRARDRDDDRGGTLPGGIPYILDMMLLSAGLGGDGVLEVRSRWAFLRPLLSELVFLSGSLLSTLRVSMLGRRLEATEGFRERSGRDTLCERFSIVAFRATVSAKLGSVSSRMSDKGRIFAQDDALMECPLGSPKLLSTIPPHPMT
jgi:hypothetical protein